MLLCVFFLLLCGDRYHYSFFAPCPTSSPTPTPSTTFTNSGTPTFTQGFQCTWTLITFIKRKNNRFSSKVGTSFVKYAKASYKRRVRILPLHYLLIIRKKMQTDKEKVAVKSTILGFYNEISRKRLTASLTLS